MLSNLLALGLLVLPQAESLPKSSSSDQLKDDVTSEEAVKLSAARAKTSLTQSQLQRSALLLLDDAIGYTKNPDLRIRSVTQVNDFADNTYALVELSPIGYGVYCPSTGSLVEYVPNVKSPFFDYDESIEKRYVPGQGFFIREGGFGDFKEVLSNTKINSSLQRQYSEISEKISSSLRQKVSPAKSSIIFGPDLDDLTAPSILEDDTPKRYDPSHHLVYADHEVAYSWYFKYNVDSFPENPPGKNICGYTALSLILGYNEIFFSPGSYFTEEESRKYIVPSTGEYGRSVPILKDEFPWDVFGEDIGGSVPADMENAAAKFLDDKDVEYHDYSHIWVAKDPTNIIRDKRQPSIVFGNFPKLYNDSRENHAAVLYGYFDDGKWLLHYGWDNRGYSQVVMNSLAFYYMGGYYGFINESPHYRHKPYFDNGYRRMCGCGYYFDC